MVCTSTLQLPCLPSLQPSSHGGLCWDLLLLHPQRHELRHPPGHPQTKLQRAPMHLPCARQCWLCVHIHELMLLPALEPHILGTLICCMTDPQVASLLMSSLELTGSHFGIWSLSGQPQVSHDSLFLFLELLSPQHRGCAPCLLLYPIFPSYRLTLLATFLGILRKY